MKKIISTLLSVIVHIAMLSAQHISGAYKTTINHQQHLLLITDDYISHIIFTDNRYLRTRGGTYNIDNNVLRVKCEYDDSNPENVGNIHHFPIEINSEGVKLENIFLEKLPSKAQALDGTWRITGRKVEDKIQVMQRGNRKTLKILVDGYFQWIAINPAEKGFYGTGGGKYTFGNNMYQEDILFFSRDNSRVGAFLNFDGEIIDTQWHHSGKSSKGEPIYEIWSREKE